MTTQIQPLTAQPISRTTLQELLSTQGQCHENLGAGVREAVLCLRDAKAFYDLPAAVSDPLERFADHLRLALAELERASELI